MMRKQMSVCGTIALIALAGCPSATTPPDLGDFPLRIRVVAESVSATVTQMDGVTAFQVDQATAQGNSWWFLGNVDPGKWAINGSFEPPRGPWNCDRVDFYLEVVVGEDGSCNVDVDRFHHTGQATGEVEFEVEVNGNGNIVIIGGGNAQGGNDSVNNGDQNSTNAGGDATGGTNQGGNANGGNDGGTTGGDDGGDDGNDDPPPPPPAQPVEFQGVFEAWINGVWEPLEGNPNLVGRTLHLRIRDLLPNGLSTQDVFATFPPELPHTAFQPQQLGIFTRDPNGVEQAVAPITLAAGQVEFDVTIPNNNSYWAAPFFGTFYIKGSWTNSGTAYPLPGGPLDDPARGTEFNVFR